MAKIALAPLNVEMNRISKLNKLNIRTELREKYGSYNKSNLFKKNTEVKHLNYTKFNDISRMLEAQYN